MSDIIKRLRKTRDPLQLEAAGEIAKCHRLLSRALDAIPNYSDGRHDKLVDAIEQALDQNQEK